MVELVVGLISMGVVIALFSVVALCYAWAISYLWLWFMVPPFGLPTLSVLQIWGIMLVLSLFRPKINLEDNNKTEKDWANAIIALLLSPLLSLGLGYAIKFWWM